ncbi:FkbM family methyltransferase [Antarctobacter heliothermus]|uniref:Methyltransferase, FkbM family n=1 Tax=Antarctobacter heliothermus TaxID=74033 RepID=A0A239DSN3_9RHOB|nr:FkbM family methyltransferase [Antarctobacter heliothermus]SNS34928.1 methyltransferase, FkbM family [Antarctobacter heliothermus]
MAQDDQRLSIGSAELLLPADHHLPRIMRQHPQYDYLYWNLIRVLLADNAIADGPLIDIGANVGDTIGHFRRFSNGSVWGIEPHAGYFDYLERNMAQFSDVRLSHAIVAPDAARDRVRLSINHGTGGSSLEPDAGEVFAGARVSPQQIAEALTSDTVLKSDTDGFDGHIISVVAEYMAQRKVRPAIVAFEGPTRRQTEQGETQRHRHALDLMLDTHRNALLSGPMMCPYLDFICVAPGLGANALFYPPRVEKALWQGIPQPEGHTATK